MKKRIFVIISALMCAVMLLSACATEKTKNNDDAKADVNQDAVKAKLAADDNLVAYVGDVPVTQEDFNLMYKLSYDQMSQYSQSYGEGWYNAEIDDDGTTIGDYMKKSAMDAISELIAVSVLAEEKGITVDENVKAAVNEGLKTLKDNFGGEEGYKTFIEESRTTEEALEKYFTRAELYNKLAEAISKEGGNSDEKLLSEFGKNYRRVQHILISTQEGRSEEDALKIANEVVSKLDGGADFDSLIDKYDEDPGQTSGSYYTFPDGQMVPEFENASKELQVGEYTKEPVKSDFGYHIIKKYEITADCEEFEEFRQKKSQDKVNEIMNEKKNSLHVEKKNDLIDKLIAEWMDELGIDTSLKPLSDSDK